MKRKDLNELHQKEIKELEDLIKKTQSELIKLKMETSLRKNKNVRLPANQSDLLARMETVLREKQLYQQVKKEEK
jgi:ribosomal protein L29